MAERLSKTDYYSIDFTDPASLLEYAKKLEGHTFQEILDLGIEPEGAKSKQSYDAREFKGGVGNLIEERYFGYKANSDPTPDFAEAGVELKTTCYDVKDNGKIHAGERLVLSMIAFDETIETDVFSSHMWQKAGKVLLIYYKRDKAISKYAQEIKFALLFTPPEEDLLIIEEDYKIIQKYIMEGRADELSESLTKYLGACTKGSTAEKSLREQKVYAPGKMAKSRAWCFKNSYMDSILHEYILGDKESESIIKDPSQLKECGFEEFVISLVNPYIGMTDKQIAEKLHLGIGPENKSFWKMIAYRLLGLDTNRAKEFEKANIVARTVRIEKHGTVKESFDLPPFKFSELAQEESWEDSELRAYVEETRFFFTIFENDGEHYRLKGAKFWSMPQDDIDGPLKDCWNQTREKVINGVTFTKSYTKTGKEIIHNDLPDKSDNKIAHVRPHARLSAYKLADGTERGDISKYADQLPDGQWMTKQSFWLNNDYIYESVTLE